MRRARPSPVSFFALALAMLIAGAMAYADEKEGASTPPKKEEPTKERIEKETAAPGIPPSPAPTAAGSLVYIRPRGAAGGREGGGTRGTTATGLVALLPEDHAALTTREQPKLYWYLAEWTPTRVDLIVNRGQDAKPLVEKTLPGPLSPGVHAVAFADVGVKLEPDVVYKWYVEVVDDPSRRSRDSFSGGTIQRVLPSAQLVTALAQAKPTERAAVFARNGIWCDALAELSTQLAAHPNDTELQGEWAALLDQVGLKGISTVPASKTP